MAFMQELKTPCFAIVFCGILALMPALTAASENTMKPTALHLAIKSGSIKNVSRLIKAGADINAIYGLRESTFIGTNVCSGITPLFEAVHAQKLKIVSMLLEAGADVDAGRKCSLFLSSWTVTPLARAAALGNRPIVEILIKANAQVFIPNSGEGLGGLSGNYTNPVSQALDGNFVKLAFYLIKQGGKAKPRDIRTAARIGNLKLVQVLLSITANVCGTDIGSDKKADRIAAEAGHQKIARLLEPLVKSCKPG